MRLPNEVDTNHGQIAIALIAANARYWTSVVRSVQYELSQWEHEARAIPDPTLRTHALTKLHDEDFNAQVAATLAVLVRRPLRRRVVAAIVAFQVMYDYLDALSEQPVEDPLGNGRQLFRAFTDALAPNAEPVDYYRHHPQYDDGGYLTALVRTCRLALRALPAAAVVEPVAQRAAARCGQAQSLTHAIPTDGVALLQAWATDKAATTELSWWEFAAGAAASVLSVHALLAAAADRGTTSAEAVEIDEVYLSICAISTLLDSLVDREQDLASNSHSYIAYYPENVEAGRRIAGIARGATSRAHALRHGPHHVVTAAGVAAYYLSSPAAKTTFARPIATRVAGELQPTITPILAIFRTWRTMKNGRRPRS
jgi:tetraprenyl-beta-curcumene synthase